mmetsp:Transcript_29241/g.97068  ORF Transcript_29241/g.97068 Transcript_29241/m.97068 type:complete len:253 (+) Transcript_29241:1665-2423(+)
MGIMPCNLSCVKAMKAAGVHRTSSWLNTKECTGRRCSLMSCQWPENAHTMPFRRHSSKRGTTIGRSATPLKGLDTRCSDSSGSGLAGSSRSSARRSSTVAATPSSSVVLPRVTTQSTSVSRMLQTRWAKTASDLNSLHTSFRTFFEIFGGTSARAEAACWHSLKVAAGAAPALGDSSLHSSGRAHCAALARDVSASRTDEMPSEASGGSCRHFPGRFSIGPALGTASAEAAMRCECAMQKQSEVQVAGTATT